jgi:hypothetical protein
MSYKGVDARMADRTHPSFSRYVGIDYSGAQTAEASLKALRVYTAERQGDPVEVPPPPSWPVFLEDFQRHWPTDAPHTYVDFVREGMAGAGAARTGYRRWRRLTEARTGAAKSVFHFDVQGSVAKSTHAGIPWLLFLRRKLGDRVHFRPFDGWSIPPDRSTVAEVYPRRLPGNSRESPWTQVGGKSENRINN